MGEGCSLADTRGLAKTFCYAFFFHDLFLHRNVGKNTVKPIFMSRIRIQKMLRAGSGSANE